MGGGQLVPGDLVGEQGVAGEDVAFGEAVEQPFRVVLHGIRAPAGVDYRFYQSSVTMMARVNLGCSLVVCNMIKDTSSN